MARSRAPERDWEATHVRPGIIRIPFRVEPFMAGGGPKPREKDAKTPVRAPGVLGQVRSFWRWTAEVASLKELREEEAKIFGEAAGNDGQAASPFSLDVRLEGPGRSFGAADGRKEKIWHPGNYRAFSTRRDRDREEVEWVQDISGTLDLRWNRDQGKDEVLRVFRLWGRLGGVGSRARRAIGAVQCEPLLRDDAALELELAAHLPKRGAIAGVQHIERIYVSEARFTTAWACYLALDAWLKAYRQHRPPSRPRPGRSYWDEPELIRNLTGQRATKHPLIPTPQGAHPTGFARAALGLPIVFEFIDPGEPSRHTLQGDDKEESRMASPVLMRPLRIGQEYAAIVTVLSGPYAPPSGLALYAGNHKAYSAPQTPNPSKVIDDLLTQKMDGKGFQVVA